MKLLTRKNWNNGDLTKSPVKMKRVHVTHQEKVNASADMVFCLASQATENQWIDKQRMRLNYSESGAAGRQIQLQSILSKEIPVMLQFGKSYCPRCKANKPVLDSAAKAYAGQAQIISVDCDVNMPLVRNFRVRLIPTQIFLLPYGKEFHRHEGFLQAPDIAQIFRKMGLPKIESHRGGPPTTVPKNRLSAPVGMKPRR